jgi:biopolymer transport protein ExbD
MKFPRNARIFRGQLDVAPFATVLFLLLLFLFLASQVYTPGIRLQLPLADKLPGTDKPKVSVAIDANGRLYFENQVIDEPELKLRLHQAVTNAAEPLILVDGAGTLATAPLGVLAGHGLPGPGGIDFRAERPRPTDCATQRGRATACFSHPRFARAVGAL